MKRRSAVFIALLVAGLAGATTASADVRGGHASQRPDDVAAYWTKQRMEKATPVERAKTANGSRTGGPTQTWSSFAISPIPYTGLDRTNGKVFFTVKGVNYVCSGTAVNTTVGSLVWTAGHCVSDGPSTFATNFMFAPGYYDGVTPYGKWTASMLYTSWSGGNDFSTDFGAARVSNGTSATLSATVGSRPLSFDYSAAGSFRSHGYPAAGKFNGQRLWACDSPLLYRDGSSATAPMGIGCDMTGGSSGGGWIRSGAVVSVNSYGYQSLKNVMFGPYQGATAQALYQSAQG